MHIQKPLFYELLYRGYIPNDVLFYRVNELLDIYLFNKALNYLKSFDKNNLYTINITTTSLVKYFDKLYNIISENNNIYLELLEKDVSLYDVVDSNFNKKIILDDFGSILSNFDRIINFKPFAVKFDKVMLHFGVSFLSVLRQELESRGILCIFEKIGTQEEYDKVKQAGFTFMQGFLLDNLFGYKPESSGIV
jgi:EAL domain-containing protein (putative c-di-GMP-specific phosphodiesterase class I)